MNEIPTKTCSKCKRELHELCFSMSKGKPIHECRNCVREYQQHHRAVKKTEKMVNTAKDALMMDPDVGR